MITDWAMYALAGQRMRERREAVEAHKKHSKPADGCLFCTPAYQMVGKTVRFRRGASTLPRLLQQYPWHEFDPDEQITGKVVDADNEKVYIENPGWSGRVVLQEARFGDVTVLD